MSLCENSATTAPEGTAACMPQTEEPLMTQPQAVRPWGAWISLALAMSIAGSAVVAGKLLVGSVPVFLAAEMGLGTGLLVMLPQLWLRRETAALDGRTHVTLALQALCGIALYRVCTFEGLRFTSAASAGLMSSAAPAVIGLLAWGMLRERPPLRRIAGIACVSLGLAAINISPFLTAQTTGLEGAGDTGGEVWRTLLGNGLVLTAVLCEAAFSVLSKARCRPMSPLRRTTLVSLYAFAMLLPMTLFEARDFDFSMLSGAAMAGIAYYGVAVSYLSYVLWFRGIAHVPASAAAAFTGLVPLSGVALSWLVLGEQILLTHLAGLVCVTAGIWLSCAAKGAQDGVGDATPNKISDSAPDSTSQDSQ
ncbi:MAG: DMT family transporter [Halodesulfovibrio sp.]